MRVISIYYLQKATSMLMFFNSNLRTHTLLRYILREGFFKGNLKKSDIS